MKIKNGYKEIPLSFNRLAVIASASVSSEKNAIHSLVEVDITEPRKRMNDIFQRTGDKLSFTAYIVTCLAQLVKENPELNSFYKGRRQIILDDVTVSVLMEREVHGEKVPEPIGITRAQTKTHLQIHNEIREAQKKQGDQLGSLSGMSWIRFIPGFLLRTFIRYADHNIKMAKRYGKVSVTAVGMFGKSSAWFIPNGTATILLTVGGICNKVVEMDGNFFSREHLCLTVSFDHNIVDGAPAARYVNQLTEIIQSGKLVV